MPMPDLDHMSDWDRALHEAVAYAESKRPRKNPETIIMRACLKWLKKEGFFAWRQNTGMMEDRGGRKIRFAVNGCADIIGIMPGGKFLAVEVKSEDGRQSENQKWFQNRVDASGGVYLLVRSLDELKRKLNPR